jgi:hypothetical protein
VSHTAKFAVSCEIHTKRINEEFKNEKILNIRTGGTLTARPSTVNRVYITGGTLTARLSTVNRVYIIGGTLTARLSTVNRVYITPVSPLWNLFCQYGLYLLRCCVIQLSCHRVKLYSIE